MLNIVLLEPEIPANTGNIGRTCVAAGTRLHLIEPLGFRLDEKNLRRAGMDYWKELDVSIYADYHDFLDKNSGLGRGEGVGVEFGAAAGGQGQDQGGGEEQAGQSFHHGSSFAAWAACDTT